MRERFARYLLGISLTLLVLFDLLDYWLGSKNSTHLLGSILLESTLDAIVVIFIYLVLKREIWHQQLLHKALDLTNAELLKANALKTRVLNMVAHDLRNPLGVMKGFAELVLEDEALPPESRDLIARIRAKADDVLGLVRDLLNTAALEKGQLKINQEPVVLNQLVQNTVEEFDEQIKKKSQRVQVQAHEPILVRTDPDRIRQVLENLMSNALKYSAPGQTVEVSLRQEKGRALLRVKDQGPGLSDKELNKIFQPFSEIKKTTTGGEPSVGLGLSIAKSLIELNHGRIWAESPGLGQGATFVVDLPLHE